MKRKHMTTMDDDEKETNEIIHDSGSSRNEEAKITGHMNGEEVKSTATLTTMSMDKKMDDNPNASKENVEAQVASQVEGQEQDQVGDQQAINSNNKNKNKNKNNDGGYNPKKPKWWKNLCGKATKSQKRATNNVLATHRLPTVEYGNFLSWDEIFPSSSSSISATFSKQNNSNIWFEIGFGRGENLLALAHTKRMNENNDNTTTFLVGAEIHKAGVGILCQRIEEGINNGTYWADYVPYDSENDSKTNTSVSTSSSTSNAETIEHCSPKQQQGPSPESSEVETAQEMAKELSENQRQKAEAQELTPEQPQQEKLEPYKNLRIQFGDGIKLLPYIPTSSLAVVLVTFPDPFPKEEQKQFRVVQPQTLLEIYRTLQKSTGRFFLATDHDGYYDWVHTAIDVVNKEQIHFQKVEPCPDRKEWLPAISTYEKKGWDEGRSTNLGCWRVCG